MLGISDQNIITHIEGYKPNNTIIDGSEDNTNLDKSENQSKNDNDKRIKIVYNSTEKGTIRDGIGGITVVRKATDQYLVTYQGFQSGQIEVTHEGVAELGESLLGEQDTVPKWLIESSSNINELPWWVPDDYEGEPILSCQNCATDTPATEVITPISPSLGTYEYLCQDCWGRLLNE